ncbi:MAG: DNA mismatch repair protein MutH [Sphingomonas bacterium]|nr:DNA mismatch repair protein MutH [Sphingomonas bacterium]
MARTTDRKRSVAASSGAALAAVLLAAPGLAAPALDQQAGQTPASESSARSAGYEKQMGQARIYCCIKWKSEFKHKGEYSVAGVGDGHVVFEDSRGNLFYIDDATGDQKFVSSKIFMKVELDRAGKSVPWQKGKNTAKVTILGVDQDGKTIMSNPRGEKFYLDAATGDMIFVK